MRSLLASCLFAALATVAAATPATPQSVAHLIDVMQTRQVLDHALQAIDQGLNRQADRLCGDSDFTPDEQAKIQEEKKQLEADLRQNLNWDRLKQAYIRVYSQTFSEEEIQAMISFYQTPIGQSVVAKMPVVMQKAQAAITPQMMQAVNTAASTLQAYVAQLEEMRSSRPAPAQP